MTTKSSLLSLFINNIPPGTKKEDYENITALVQAIESIQYFSDPGAVGQEMTLNNLMACMLEAHVTIDAGTFVALNDDGMLVAATPTSVVGYCSDIIQAGESGRVIFQGKIRNESWNLVPGELYAILGPSELVRVPDNRLPRALSFTNAFSNLYHFTEAGIVGVSISPQELLLDPKYMISEIAYSNY